MSTQRKERGGRERRGEERRGGEREGGARGEGEREEGKREERRRERRERERGGERGERERRRGANRQAQAAVRAPEVLRETERTSHCSDHTPSSSCVGEQPRGTGRVLSCAGSDS